MMWYLIFLLPLLGTACCGFSKPKLNPSSISRSFVNLGKMDISFYINTKNDPFQKAMQQSIHPYQAPDAYYQKPNPIPPCPCSSLKNFKEPSTNPSDILNKILSSNDLFRTSDDSESTACCNSQEFHDETFIIDLTKPKVDDLPISSTFLTLPFTMESFAQPALTNLLPKNLEFLFNPAIKESPISVPNKKGIKTNKKESIKVVGDKIGKSFFKDFTMSADKVNPSVKKELTVENPEINAESPEGKTTNVADTNAL